MQKKKIFTIDNSLNQKLWVLNQSEACTKNQKPNSSGYFEAPEWNERARASYIYILLLVFLVTFETVLSKIY